MVCQMMSLNAAHKISTNLNIGNKRTEKEVEILNKMISTLQKSSKSVLI